MRRCTSGTGCRLRSRSEPAPARRRVLAPEADGADMNRPPAPAPVAHGRRRCLRVAASLPWLVAAGGCHRGGPLQVGFIGGLSGRVADLGIGGRNGAQLAVDDVNARGGVDGRPLELLVRDDEQNEAVARMRFVELVDAGVRFVVGPMTSNIAVVLAGLALEKGLALISPTATTVELSGRDDAFFRVLPDARAGATQQAELLLRRGRRRLVTVSDLRNRAFSRGWNDAAASHFTAGGGALAAAVDFEAAPGLRFAELAERIAAIDGDAVLIAASAADSALLAQQLRRLRPQALVMLSSWAGTEQLVQLGGRSLDGVLVAQYFDRASPSAAYVGFVDRYQRRFGEVPGYPSVNAYDAVGLGAQGVRRAAGGRVLDGVRATREFDGLQRRIVLDGSGDCQAPIFHAEIRDGRYVAVPS